MPPTRRLSQSSSLPTWRSFLEQPAAIMEAVPKPSLPKLLALPAPPKLFAMPASPKLFALPAPSRLLVLPAPPKLLALLALPKIPGLLAPSQSLVLFFLSLRHVLPESPLLEPIWSIPPALPWPLVKNLDLPCMSLLSRPGILMGFLTGWSPSGPFPLAMPWLSARIPDSPNPAWSVPLVPT